VFNSATLISPDSGHGEPSAVSRRFPSAESTGGEVTIRGENLAAAAAVLGGLGISVWLACLDYRRRLPAGQRSLPAAGGSRLLDSGLGLVAVGVVLDRILGAGGAWRALLSWLPALAGIILVAAHTTRRLSGASRDDGGNLGRKK
jgi:hypothetical protein